jgi:hypothetical protein
MYDQERTLLRSAKSLGLSVERLLQAFLPPHSLEFAAIMSADGRLSPLASAIWAWDKSGLINIGSIRVFLPVALYGKITAYLHCRS